MRGKMGDDEYEFMDMMQKRHENEETAKLLKESLKIIDKLAGLDINEIITYQDADKELEELVKRANKLKRHRLWRLR